MSKDIAVSLSKVTQAVDAMKWVDRINKNSRPEHTCKIWTGPLDRYGYGVFWFRDTDGRKRMTGAHRAAWLAVIGPLSDDQVIDHLCRVPACVDVNHLEAVDNRENTKRGRLPDVMIARRGVLLSKCKQHGEVDGYVRHYDHGRARWVCRICDRERQARFKRSTASK